MPGLRRAELAVLANVSVEYLTKLERGNATDSPHEKGPQESDTIEETDRG